MRGVLTKGKLGYLNNICTKSRRDDGVVMKVQQLRDLNCYLISSLAIQFLWILPPDPM